MFAKRLKNMLLEYGISANYLAKKTGIPQGTISNWLNRGTDPNIFDLVKVANFFACSIDYIIGRETEDGRLLTTGELTPVIEVPEIMKLYNQLARRDQARLLAYGRGLCDAAAGFTF